MTSLRHFCSTVSIAMSLIATTFALPTVAQESECRGGKQWYQGACRYPDEIDKLKGAAPKPTPKPPTPTPPTPTPPTPTPPTPKPPTPTPPTPIPTLTPPPAAPIPTPPALQPPLVQPVPPHIPVPIPPRRRPRVSISPLVWIGGAVAGAGLIVGAITGGVSFGQAKDLQEACGDDNVCPPEQQEDIDAMLLLANVSNVSFAVAGAGAVVGVVGLAITDWSPTPSEVALRLEATPGGFRLLGSF